jgi:5-methylcytosine-specific restriction endonuclease McrA
MVKDRDYGKEYREYHAKPEQKKNRAKRNAARSMLAKKGAVSKGDGKDVDHKTPIRSGGGNSQSNLRVTTKAKNRGWRGK